MLIENAPPTLFRQLNKFYHRFFEGLNNANWDLHSLYMNPALVQTGHDPEPKQILFIPVLKAMRFSFVYCLSRLHPIPFQTLVWAKCSAAAVATINNISLFLFTFLQEGVEVGRWKGDKNNGLESYFFMTYWTT